MSEDQARGLTRRRFLGGMLTAGLALGAHPVLASLPPNKPRLISFENLHTGEKLRNVPYWEGGRYQADAMQSINHILRDFRTGDVHPMDTQLIDLIHMVHRRVGSHQPYQIISGYRSPKTNALLHSGSDGVAKKSMHMEGKAIDVRLSDRGVKDIQTAGLQLSRGGVGYYPDSNFVHLDTGRVRKW